MGILKGENGAPNRFFVAHLSNLPEVYTSKVVRKNPSGEFLKSRAMQEGVEFCGTPSLPKTEKKSYEKS